MRNKIKAAVEAFRDWRCVNVHNDPRWPVHGRVECRQCQRKITLKEVR
jgi:hypothetical protein